MKRHPFTSVLLGVVVAVALAAALAPTASRASGPYSAGHFVLSLDGEPALFDAVGELSSEKLVLRGGTATPALGSWAKSAALKDATVVVYDRNDRPVARYYLENAWPAVEGESVAFYYQRIIFV